MKRSQDLPKLYIPSRGRATKLITPYTLPPMLQAQCCVVVRHDELLEYSKAAGDDRKFEFLTLPKNFNGGISETRQWILDNSGEDRIHVQIDDDVLSFSKKLSLTKIGGLVKCNGKDIHSAFNWLIDNLRDGCAHTSLSRRTVSAFNTNSKGYMVNNATMQISVYDRDAIKASGARFDRVDLMQDTDMCLQLLEAGYSNRISTKYSYTCRPHGMSGGCEIFRTDALREKAGRRMEALHPGVVTYKQKVRKDGAVFNTIDVKWRIFNGRV